MTVKELTDATAWMSSSDIEALLFAMYPTAGRPMLLATADLLAQYRCAQAHPNTAGFLERLLAQRLVYLQKHT